MSGRPIALHISRVQSRVTEEELATTVSAVPSLWPAPQARRRMIDDRAWHFSGRRLL
jgi:hypothetical protein